MSASKGPTQNAWEREDRARKAVQAPGSMETLQAILDRVIVAPQPSAETSPGGIHIPDEHRYQTGRGVVIALGPGDPKRGLGGETAMQDLAVGDVVLFGRRAGVPVQYANGERVLVLRVWDILCVIGTTESPCGKCGRADPGRIHVDSVALFD